MKRVLVLAVFVTAMIASAWGDIVVPGADGSDGKLDVTTNLTIDLSKAVTGKWDDPGGDVDGDGVSDGIYDAEKWVIVFKYESVRIAANKYVAFKNHPSNPPVVWLVNGNVSIEGGAYILLNGQDEQGTVALGGPGGFRGGQRWLVADTNEGGGGMGPGGGVYTSQSSANSAAHATPAVYGNGNAQRYGNTRACPLMGGSGGGAHRGRSDASGGGGGGAILIAATGEIQVVGAIYAQGGQCYYHYEQYHSSGSGGAIRLIADRVTGKGAIYCNSRGWGGYGRIRIEANSYAPGDLVCYPGEVFAPGVEEAELWPPAEAIPSVKVTKLGGKSVPNDPRSDLSFPNADVGLAATDDVDVRIEAMNIPVDGSWKVTVRAVPKSGFTQSIDATLESGDSAASIWTAKINLGNGFSAIQVRAAKK